MSVIPVAIEAERISALVVGGGAVATRKTLSLLAAGATIRVIAPTVSDELAQAAGEGSRLTIERRQYAGPSDIASAFLVFAATSSDTLNEQVAADAMANYRLVDDAGEGSRGNFTSMATHRAGDVTIGVSASGVPGAAMRIRDSIAARIDHRYASAIRECSELRETVLRNLGAESWRAAHARLFDEHFCARVESGELSSLIETCR